MICSSILQTVCHKPLLMFTSYFTYYAPYFAILPLSTSPDAVHKSCPLLFWTIILTGARHDTTDFSLLPALIPAVKSLMWLQVGCLPHMLPTLQAFAILCVFPFPESSMATDTTFVLAGVLKSAAMHVGLHRPDVMTEYARSRLSLNEAEHREAVRVWSYIFLAIEG
jgi:hypothetical protein